MSICPRVPGWVRGGAIAIWAIPKCIAQHLKWAIQRRRSRAPVPLLHSCTFSDCPRSPLHSCSSSNPLFLSLLLSLLLYLCLRFNHQSAILCPSLVPLFWNAPQQTELQCELNQRQSIPMYSRNHSAALNWSPKVFFCTLAHLQSGFDQPDQCFYWILSQKMCEEKQKCARRIQQKLKGGTFVSQQLHSCGHCNALESIALLNIAALTGDCCIIH